MYIDAEMCFVSTKVIIFFFPNWIETTYNECMCSFILIVNIA